MSCFLQKKHHFWRTPLFHLTVRKSMDFGHFWSLFWPLFEHLLGPHFDEIPWKSVISWMCTLLRHFWAKWAHKNHVILSKNVSLFVTCIFCRAPVNLHDLCAEVINLMMHVTKICQKRGWSKTSFLLKMCVTKVLQKVGTQNMVQLE